ERAGGPRNSSHAQPYGSHPSPRIVPMRKIAVLPAAVLSVLAFLPAEAQKLEAGKWSGTVTPPDEPIATQVTYDVTVRGDTISITATAAEHGSFQFSDVRLSGDTLTFWFTPGPRVDCTL